MPSHAGPVSARRRRVRGRRAAPGREGAPAGRATRRERRRRSLEPAASRFGLPGSVRNSDGTHRPGNRATPSREAVASAQLHKPHQLCALRSALCALRSALCALRSALCALRSALCALRSALCAHERTTSSPRCQVHCAKQHSAPRFATDPPRRPARLTRIRAHNPSILSRIPETHKIPPTCQRPPTTARGVGARPTISKRHRIPVRPRGRILVRGHPPLQGGGNEGNRLLMVT